MGKVKRLELWWQLYLYVTSGSGLRKKTSDHFMCVWVYNVTQASSHLHPGLKSSNNHYHLVHWDHNFVCAVNNCGHVTSSIGMYVTVLRKKLPNRDKALCLGRLVDTNLIYITKFRFPYTINTHEVLLLHAGIFLNSPSRKRSEDKINTVFNPNIRWCPHPHPPERGTEMHGSPYNQDVRAFPIK
jgi:hypothetical protein